MKRIIALLVLCAACTTAAANEPSKLVVEWLNPGIIVPGDTMFYRVLWSQDTATTNQRPYLSFDLELTKDNWMTVVQSRSIPYVSGTNDYSDTLTAVAPPFDSVLVLAARLRNVTVDTVTAWVYSVSWSLNSIVDPPTPPVITGIDTVTVSRIVDTHVDPFIVSVMVGAEISLCAYAELAHPDSVSNWFAIPAWTGCAGPGCTEPGILVPQRADCFGIRFDDFVFRMSSMGIG